MTATEEASRRASYSRRKGATAEQSVARYLRQWWPQACRAVRTGSSAAADPGDIANVPMLVSVKNAQTPRWPAWWAELDAMLLDDPAALGFIVEKRAGQADPAMWWAHLRLADVVALAHGCNLTVEGDRTPVRLRLGDLVDLLVGAGYARSRS